MAIPALQNVLAFVHTIETGQLRAAARRLKVSESAISHRLTRLEAELGVRLLERGPHGVALTPAGKRFFARARPAVEELEAAVFDIRQPSIQTLTVTMPQSFASMWFAPRLCDLYCEFPDMELDVRPTQRICDLKREGIDVGIRQVPAAQADADAIPLVQEMLTPVCTPENAIEIQRLGWCEFLRTQGAVLNALHVDEWTNWCDAFGMQKPVSRNIRMLATFELVTSAVASGYGVAIGRTPLIDAHLADGRLVMPFPDKILPSHWYYLASVHQPLAPQVLGQFKQWIEERLSNRAKRPNKAAAAG